MSTNTGNTIDSHLQSAPRRDAADALVKRALELSSQHSSLFAEHNLPTDVLDRLLDRDDLPPDVRDRLQQELAAASAQPTK